MSSSSNNNNVGDVELGILEINRVAAAPQNPVQSTEAFTTPTVNDGISLVERRSRSDVTTRNLSRSDELTIGFLLDCAKRGRNCRNQRQPSICKVSRILRDHSESSYEPVLVSIGPIHREDPKLKEFEWQKECYLNDLLNRFPSRSAPKEILEACLLKVNTLIPQIRKCYADVKKNYSDVELARMMVMDGCFILEFCFKHERGDNWYLQNKMQNTRIAMDLMLLENQVPFFVLQALFDCSMGKVSFSTLSDVLDKYLAPYIQLFRVLPEKKSIFRWFRKLLCSLLPKKISTTYVDSHSSEKISTTDIDSDSTPAHVLGYLHKRYQLVAAKSSNPTDDEELKLADEEGTAFHSIVELDLSGIKFKPHQEDIWSMTIKFKLSFFPCFRWLFLFSCCCCCYCCCLFPCLPWFWIKPTFLMPTLVIQDNTELILRNFIAYEQSFLQDRYYFTSYACAMDKLIDTQEDIAKLVESKVLVNQLGTNQDAADMINKVCKNISVTDFYYFQQFKQMDICYSSCLPKHTAWLRRVYFNNPWNSIALVAAIILFGLTVVQTIFTIRAA